jgi:putative membrane protein
MLLEQFPALNACLNTTSAIFLCLGFFFIKNKQIVKHSFCMLSACATSLLFLISYLYYHAHHGATGFTGQGVVRPIYFLILISHTILAALIVPLVLVTLFRALRQNWVKHAQIARWTLPVWFYVSVTGVVVYWMLYRVEY